MRKICLPTLLAILLLPALAWAQPRTADEWYKEGANQYNLGSFDKAVDAFKQGFALETDESKKPAYLYNVAQSYRQAGDCKNALFFYRRFLSLKDNDTAKPLPPKTRKDVEGWIAEAEVCVRQAASFVTKPPNTNLPPDGDGNDKSPPPDPRKDPRKDVAVVPHHDDGDEDDGGPSKPAAVAGPHLISARLTGGGSKIGAGNVDVPIQATFALIAGYPIAINRQLMIDAGIAFTFTPVPYTIDARAGMPARNKTGQLIALMANAGVTYEVIPKVGVRGDVGVGALFFNASESQFTSGNPTSGALTMFHARVALSADYAVTPNLLVTATPLAFSFSPPKEGLDKSISSLTAIDFMVGLGYRM